MRRLYGVELGAGRSVARIVWAGDAGRGLPIGIGRDAGTVEAAGFVCFGGSTTNGWPLTPASANRRIL
ncbi:hypothetical protein BN3659_00443 [Alistipes sp. CHKCI003]|nr:hypothetical protein BN3659_00443 [Alistipes sp. CHKCI003]